MSDTVVIDGKGHLLGRLASIVAKQLLFGKKVVVVRCEAMIISGSCKQPSNFRALPANHLLIIPLSPSDFNSDEKQGQVCPVHQEENEHQPRTWSFPLPLPRENFLENCKLFDMIDCFDGAHTHRIIVESNGDTFLTRQIVPFSSAPWHASPQDR
jgi:hypothetical protein